MMKYGHLNANGDKLVYAKYPVRVGNTDYFLPSAEIMLSAGEKEIIDNVKPEDTYKGKYIMSFEENDTQIIKKWTFTPFTDEEKERIYDKLSVSYIRKKYTADDENKIMREYLAYGDVKKEAFDIYNSYVEECKATARAEVYDVE